MDRRSEPRIGVSGSNRPTAGQLHGDETLLVDATSRTIDI
jgi:hypothetical protein